MASVSATSAYIFFTKEAKNNIGELNVSRSLWAIVNIMPWLSCVLFQQRHWEEEFDEVHFSFGLHCVYG